MERTSTIEINGKTYTLCYNMRASFKMKDIKPLKKKDPSMYEAMEYYLDMLYPLLEGGAEYERAFLGKESTFDLTREQLSAFFCPNDFALVVKSVNEAMGVGTQREIEVTEEKKQETAPQQEKTA